MKISVFGIGYVGAVTSACLAECNHSVIAVDTNQTKVKCLNEGRAPLVENGLDSLVEQMTKQGRLSATSNLEKAILETEISLICVGTPSRPDGSLDLQYVEQVCRQIGEVLKTKDEYHTVVLRSTMVPGSAMGVCLPILEQASGKIAGINFGFGNNPEFLREGSAIADYYTPPKIVVGANDEKSARAIMSLYDGIDAPRVTTAVATAEGVKYADNAWHAMKVGFANEFGNIMKKCGVDSHDVMDIFCMDTKLNISPAYLKPGFAFGGSCLPKDVRAIRAAAAAHGLQTPIFDSLLSANEAQIGRALDMIRNSGRRHVGMLGLSFKPGTDDLRESPLVKVADKLVSEGYTLTIYDTNVFRSSQANGPCHNHLQKSMPHIAAALTNDIDKIKENADIFVIGHNDPDFSTLLGTIEDKDIPIIDLVRLNAAIESRRGYEGICW